MGKSLSTVIYVSALLSLILTVFILDKGIIASDEAWYLYLLREVPSDVGAVRFQLFFKNVFRDNIFLVRIVWFVLSVLSSAVFSWGIRRWMCSRLGREAKLSLVWASVLCGHLFLSHQPSIHYISLNLFAAELSLGFLLGALDGKRYLFLPAGFFAASLAVIMTPNVIWIPLVLLFVGLESPSSSVTVRNLSFYIAGMGLFAVYYFLCVEQPEVFVSYVQEETSNSISRGSSVYGLLFYLRWTAFALAFIFKYFVAAFLIRSVEKFGIPNVFSVVGILVFCSIFICPTYGLSWTMLYYLFWAGFFYFLLKGSYCTRGSVDCLLPVLLALTPLCLSFGTNMPFSTRGISYLVFLAPCLFLLPDLRSAGSGEDERAFRGQQPVVARDYVNGRGPQPIGCGRDERSEGCRPRNALSSFMSHFRWSVEKYLGVYVAVMTVFMLFSISGSKWDDSRWLDQKVPLTSYGINQRIKVSEKDASLLELCSNRLPEQPAIMVDKDFWIIPELKGWHCMSNSFDLPYFERITSLVESCEDPDGLFLLLSMKERGELVENLTRYFE